MIESMLSHVQPISNNIVAICEHYGLFNESKAVKNFCSTIHKRILSQNDMAMRVRLVDVLSDVYALLSRCETKDEVKNILVSFYFCLLELGVVSLGNKFENTGTFQSIMDGIDWDAIAIENLFAYDKQILQEIEDDSYSINMPFGILALPTVCYMRGVL